MRRILRRAVRYGRTLGFHEPFFFKLVDVVARTLGDVFPEVRKNQSRVKETIQREEESFNRTLDHGIELFEQLSDSRQFLMSLCETAAAPPTSDSGLLKWLETIATTIEADHEGGIRQSEWEWMLTVRGLARTAAFGSMEQRNATLLRQRLRELSGSASKLTEYCSVFLPRCFRLYDEQGFPLDLTQLMARERGLTVDVAGFEKLMEEQRSTRARRRRKRQRLNSRMQATRAPTNFLGYEQDLTSSAEVLDVLDGERSKAFRVLK